MTYTFKEENCFIHNCSGVTDRHMNPFIDNKGTTIEWGEVSTESEDIIFKSKLFSAEIQKPLTLKDLIEAIKDYNIDCDLYFDTNNSIILKAYTGVKSNTGKMIYVFYRYKVKMFIKKTILKMGE